MFKIEKGIKMPTKMQPRKYPWTELEVGDSFSIPLKDGKPASLKSVMYIAAKRLNRKFELRVLKTEIRIWRTV